VPKETSGYAREGTRQKPHEPMITTLTHEADGN
jgi:hypothetical protein